MNNTTNTMVGTAKGAKNYYSVGFGKIVKSYGKNKPSNEEIKVTERVNRKGDIVYEEMHDYLEGTIVEARIDEHPEYGDSIQLDMEHYDNTATLSIKLDSSYGRNFMYKMLEFDAKEKVKISPYDFIGDEGKKVVGLCVYQNGDKIANAYSKDEPNGLPQLKPTTFKGKKTWDNTKQLEFLKKKFVDFQESVACTARVEPDEVFG